MPAKLGPHCITPTASARQMIDAGCRIVKLLDDFGLAPELADKGVTVIGRSYARDPGTAESQRGENPESAARRFINSQKEVYDLNPSIKIWEGHNEPIWGNREDMAWYARFEVARLRMLADMGLRGTIGQFNTGGPDLEWWPYFYEAVGEAIRLDAILNLHEYSSPWVWWMTGKYQVKEGEDAGDEGWTTLRYRKVLRQYLVPNGLGNIKIFIGEFGCDLISQVRPGMKVGKWKDLVEFWGKHDGKGDPIDYWRGTERDPEIYYAEQLIWYDKEIQKDRQVIGATVFCTGSNNAAWNAADIAGSRVVPKLSSYIVGADDVTPPDEPPGPPPIEDGPHPGVNVLGNAGFDQGHYKWHNVNEITIPVMWDFWYQADKAMRLESQDQSFDPPECVVWNKRDAPPEEQDLFFLSGDFCLKVFKGWGAIWWRLFQTVVGLRMGGKYVFKAPVFPDLVMKYEGSEKMWADDPMAGEIRLYVEGGAVPVSTDWMNGNHFPFGAYTVHQLPFVAASESVTVVLEGRGRWGLVNNGWMVDSMVLEETEMVPVPVPMPVPTPVPSGPGPDILRSWANILNEMRGRNKFLADDIAKFIKD